MGGVSSHKLPSQAETTMPGAYWMLRFPKGQDTQTCFLMGLGTLCLKNEAQNRRASILQVDKWAKKIRIKPVTKGDTKNVYQL